MLSASTWAAVVWVWPGLHLGYGAGGRGLQPAVLIAAASIQAAVIVLGLAVGAIVLQVMANYSWAVVRSVLPGWLAPMVVVVVGAGVFFPLWVSFSPTVRMSTAAFAAFGWSMLAVGATVWGTAQRMNPPSLSVHTRRRAARALSSDRRGGSASVRVAEILSQLVADADLPYGESIRLVGSYTFVLADRARMGLREEVAVAVRALGERAVRVQSPAAAVSIVRALWVLGLDQARNPRVFDELYNVLTAIARDARKRGLRETGAAALDALADITINRVGWALPPVGYRIAPRSPVPPPPPRRSEDGSFPRPTFPSSLPPTVSEAEPLLAGSRASRRDLLNQFVEDFAMAERRPAAELTATMAAGLVRPADVTQITVMAQRDMPAWWSIHDLLEETAETFMSLLPSPQPESTGWPAGWQGHGTFDTDVQRLAMLADRLYRQSKHVPIDLIEASLEAIGVRLRTEQQAPTDLPAARTSWRYPPTRREEGGIAATTASCLNTLMESAFDAGFDRRALSTGLRILASATASARKGDHDATMAYAEALMQFIRDKSLHGLEASSQAGSQRAEALLIGLITECDQLLNAAREQKGRNRQIYEAVGDLASALAWNAPKPRMFSTVIAMLQTRLLAAGWPVSLPSGQRRIHELDEPVAQPLAKPLSGELLRDVEELFSHWLGHSETRLPAGALLTLWAHAACAARDGALDEVKRIAAFLTRQLHVHEERYKQMPTPLAAGAEQQRPGDQPLDAHLRRLTLAAVRWCLRADPRITPTIPRAAGPRTALSISRWLVSQPDTADWTYRGAQNEAETPMITVEMPDHSRRILRDADLRTGELTWGYYGTGPHDLAAVLIADILADYRECPDCIGASPLAASMITCRSCSNSGDRPGTAKAEGRLLTTVIGKLPDKFSQTRLELLRAISCFATDALA